MARAAVVLLLLLLGSRAALAGGGPAETVVLVNSASADSRRVADHYAKRRGIPAQQVCEVRCGTGPTTTMDEFVRDVVDPLREFLRARGLEERCRFVVLTQGMPIVAHTPGGMVSTAAALSLADTEICGQPQTRVPALRNPYTDGPAPSKPILGSGRFLLVTALVSTTAEEAMALVDRSVESDGTAPRAARFVFQDAARPADVRNDRYDAARAELEAKGFSTEHTTGGRDVVRGRANVMGWLSGGSYSDLDVAGVNSNRYLPGAICDMLQSYGAVPANFGADAGKFSQFAVTHMIRAGITGVHGAVAEPYNVAFPDAHLFRPYVEGLTLAEAFHQRMPLAYWMNLTIGDPLCAPYAKRPEPRIDAKGPWKGVVAASLSAPGAVRIDAYLDGRAVASVEGAQGAASIDTSAFADGPHQLLVEATGEGPAEPRGWVVATVTTKGAPPRPVSAARAPQCERIVAEVPAAVRAGERFVVRATAADAGGKPVAGWKGRLELRSAVPPVRWSRVDSPGPSAELPSRMTRTGDYELRVTAPDDRAEATVRVRVDPGPFHHATCAADSFPLGQECEMEVVLEDAFGNRLAAYDGSIELSVPGDPSASLPPPLAMTTGRGVLEGVLLIRAGPASLVFKDAAGRVVSQDGEGVNVGRTAIRPWLVAGPAAAKTLFAADATASAVGEGSLAAKLPLVRRRGGDVVQLPAGNPKGGDAAVLVTWIEALAATKARLLAAAPGRVRVLLDGKEVFDGAPKASDPNGKREPVAELQLAPGIHRLAVVLETKGPASASFEIDDGNGQFPASLRVRARSGETARK